MSSKKRQRHPILCGGNASTLPVVVPCGRLLMDNPSCTRQMAAVSSASPCGRHLMEKPSSTTTEITFVPTRSVGFSKRVLIYEEKPYLTHQEIIKCFYSIEDIDRFDKERSLTALSYKRREQHGMQWDDDTESIRGLEDVFSRVPKKTLRSKHVAQILAEQKRQKEAGCTDPEELREVSLRSSKDDRHRAVTLGRADALSGYRTPASLLTRARQKLSVILRISERIAPSAVDEAKQQAEAALPLQRPR